LAKLLLVRHGNTKLNSALRFWGQTDVRLSCEGISQAELLRDRLAEQKINAIYASNLSRALVTAEIITSRHQLAITTSAELGEMDFGVVEGLTFDEIKQQKPKLAMQLFDWQARPEFPGGESLDELNERVKKFLPVLAKHTPEETVLVVAHSGVLRLLICNLLGIALEHWRQLQIDLASLSIVDAYPEGAILSQLNDTSHLQN